MDIKNNISQYWCKRSNTYDQFPAPRSEAEETALYHKHLEANLKGADLKVLDVGAGTGFISLILAGLGHHTTCLDISEGMLDKARHKVEASGYRAAFHIGDAENLPFEDGLFDAVVSRYLLWTLPNTKQALRDWKRVTRRGGRIICFEGKWQDSSVQDRFKRFCRQLGILLYEKTNPAQLGYDNSTAKALPLCDGLTPETAAALFEECGLTDIAVEKLTEIRNIRARNMPLLYRLSMSDPMFLITGEVS